MTRLTGHISETPPPQPPPGVEYRRGATIYTPPSMRPLEHKPEDPELDASEIARAAALGLTVEEAEDAKVAAYQAEATRFGAPTVEEWLLRRPAMQATGLVPDGPPVWPIKEPAELSPELEEMKHVRNVHDFAALQARRAQAAEVDAEARRQLALEARKAELRRS